MLAPARWCVGYNVTISDGASFWPRVGVTFVSASTNTSIGTTNANATESRFSLQVFAPFVFHLAPHFFLGLGPNFSTDLTSSTSSGGQSGDGEKVTTFGLGFLVGGWFLGD
jgi:hypothetical protein